jgi:hypothetical protein
MPSSCANINQNILLDCAKRISAGANDNLYLINYDEVAGFTPDNLNPNLITAIALASGGFIYKFQGQNDSVEPRSVLVETRYTKNYDHEVLFKVFDNTAEIKDQIDRLAQGRVIAIVENNFAGSDDATKFEIYGLKAGLLLRAAERIVADQETQGAYNLTLRSSDQSKEPNLPATFFDTSITVTRGIINSLLKP